jgi:hypothetical protein
MAHTAPHHLVMSLAESTPLHKIAGRGCDFSWLGDWRKHAIVCAAQGIADVPAVEEAA